MSFVVLSLLLSTYPTSAEGTANKSSDLTDRDTEDEDVLEEDGVTGEEEEEEQALKMRAMRRTMRKMSRFQC